MHAKAGKKAGIIAKMNALLEPEIIDELYEASKAGVRVDLIVRGVCGAAAGHPGPVREHPRALDHRPLPRASSRVPFRQHRQHLHLSSADWMDRNFFRRIEVCLPVLDPKLKKRVVDEGLKKYLDDNVQAWEMNSDGRYERCKPGKSELHSAQLELLQELASPQQPEAEAQAFAKLRPRRKAKAAA